MRCGKCGKDTDPLVKIVGLCVDCFLEETLDNDKATSDPLPRLPVSQQDAGDS